MALTVAKDSGNYGALFTPKIYAKGDIKFLTGKISFDNSYPTGGEALDLSAHFDTLLGVMIENKAGYSFEYDYTNKKVKAFVPVGVIADAGVSDANNTIMKSAAGTLEVAGTGTAFQQAAVEVADTTDLSALTGVRLIAWGY
jgi:hypothetical protein